MRNAWKISLTVSSSLLGSCLVLGDRAVAQSADDAAAVDLASVTPDVAVISRSAADLQPIAVAKPQPIAPDLIASEPLGAEPIASEPITSPTLASQTLVQTLPQPLTPADNPTIAQADTPAQNQGKTPLNPVNSPIVPPIAPPEVLLQPETVAPAPPANPAPATDAATTVPIQRITVTGSTVFTAAELAAIVQPFEGQSLTFAQIQGIADRITQRYLQAGYLTSRATLPAQTIADGQLAIQIREGSLESVEILGNQRLTPDYIRKQIQPGLQVPLNQVRLEDQLRLLKLDPLLDNVEASLRQGTQPGRSVLTVRVAEAPAIFGSVTIDNDLVPAVGSERALVTLGYRNPSGVGDRLYASYARSFTGGAHLWDIGYQYPLNPMQGTLNLRLAPSRYRVTNGPFKDLDIGGSAGYYDLSVRQPIVRSPRQELALTLGLGHRTGKTLVSDFVVDQSVTTVLRFGQDLLKRDAKGHWLASSQFNFGLPWLGANTDREPDGQFFSWNGSIGRTQRLSLDHALQFQLNWQFTPDALPPTQQFTIGGRQSLRGYRQSLRNADNGLSFSLEHQFTLRRNPAGVAVLQLTPFVELGTVWNAAANPTPRSTQNFLATIGAGLRWRPTEKWEMRLDYGLPLVRANDRGQNLHDAALYFGLKYNF